MLQDAASFRDAVLKLAPVVGGVSAGEEIEVAVGEWQGFGGRPDGLDGEPAPCGLGGHGGQHRFGQVARGGGGAMRGDAVGDVATATAEVERAGGVMLRGKCFDPVQILTGGMDRAADIALGLRAELAHHMGIMAGLAGGLAHRCSP